MKSTTTRFTALDVLRGMTVCFMIIVNTGGNGDTTWAPLQHARWHGFTPTDLVFPTFMFVVGNALSFVMQKWEGFAESKVFGIILKRTIIIFLLGYLMYWFPFVHWTPEHTLAFNPVGNTRIMGVLQRIALGYFFGALLIRHLEQKTLIRTAVAMLLLYWALLLLFAQGSDPYDMLGNTGSRIDRWLFGSSHLYHGEGVAFDPEGLLSTLPSIVNVIVGYLAGKWVQQQGKSYEGLAKLLMAGILLVLLALGWDWFMPINKKLWTSSYVLLTVGIDCILLGGLIYIVDFLGYVRWTNFFQVFGKNPLFIYLLSELGATLLWFTPIGEKHQPLYAWSYHHIFEPTGAYLGSFLFAVSFMLCCWIAGYVLDKRKIYVRV